MAETVQEIREWYYEGGFTSEERPYRERIGTLLAEIDRLEVIEMCFLYATTELAKVHARLDRAVAVCEALDGYRPQLDERVMDARFHSVLAAHNTYLAGKEN